MKKSHEQQHPVFVSASLVLIVLACFPLSLPADVRRTVQSRFNEGREGWRIYDYNGGKPGGGNHYFPAVWGKNGGVENSGYIWADDSKWRIDTPEEPDSILPFIIYRSWVKGQALDTAGITAADVIAPQGQDDRWTMFFSAWQDVPAGTEAPMHPSRDPAAANTGLSDDFAATSIASEMAGYRSRIFTAHSPDGLVWELAAASSRAAAITAMNWMRYTRKICRWSKSKTVSIACTTLRAIAMDTGELRVQLVEQEFQYEQLVAVRPLA